MDRYAHVLISGNSITSDSLDFNTYGIKLDYTNEFDILKNRVFSDSCSAHLYGIWLFQCVGANNPRSQIQNNCVITGSDVCPPNAGSAFYNTNSGIINIINNTFMHRSSAGTGASFLGGGLIEFRNNIVMTQVGWSLNVSNQYVLVGADNNIFSPSSIFYNGTQYTSLQDYNSATGWEVNSPICIAVFC